MVSFLFPLLFNVSVYAAETAHVVYINELQIEPTQQVEIVNRGTDILDVSGWFIDDDGGTTYVTIPEGTVIEPNSCIVIDGKFNLNKSSADTIRLFDDTAPPTDSQAKLIDYFTYNASPGDFQSFQRSADGSVTWSAISETLGKWNDSLLPCRVLPSPTPLATIAPTPTTTPLPTAIPDVGKIRISEAFVYPDSGDKEWIELYNPNTFEVTLLNWYIDDQEEGGATPRKFTLVLPSKGYGVYEIATGIFNNAGDSVRILNAKEQVIDSFIYTYARKGISLGRTDLQSDTVCFQEATRGYENESCLPEEKTATGNPFPSASILPSPSFHNNTLTKQEDASFYTISSTLPEISSSEQTILGEDVQIYQIHKNPRSDSLLFLTPAYSLLSIVSLTVKMKLK